VKEGALVVLDQFSLEAPRTRTVEEYSGKVGKSVLIVDGDNQNLMLSARNIRKSNYITASALNVFDILKHEKLVMTQAAIDAVVAKASIAGKKAQRDGAEAVA
jgi:large subunit ribosomal protein L4